MKKFLSVLFIAIIACFVFVGCNSSVGQANVKHWHGAAKDSVFQHLAIEVPAENGKTEWCEPVTDDEYGKLEG